MRRRLRCKHVGPCLPGHPCPGPSAADERDRLLFWLRFWLWVSAICGLLSAIGRLLS